MRIDPDDQVVLDGHAVAAAGLDDWRYVLGRLHARFRTGDFATGVRLVTAVGTAADAADHHPDVDLRYPHVDVVLLSHDVGGLTRRDLRLAATISGLAREVGAPAVPAQVQAVEWALDTPDPARLKPFWAAVLAHDPGAGDDDEVLDGDGRTALWFQVGPPTATPPQRFHLDVTVAPEEAEQRVAAALAAGGTLVTDAHAPAFWVLADAEGNKACVCTWQGRDADVDAP